MKPTDIITADAYQRLLREQAEFCRIVAAYMRQERTRIPWDEREAIRAHDRPEIGPNSPNFKISDKLSL